MRRWLAQGILVLAVVCGGLVFCGENSSERLGNRMGEFTHTEDRPLETVPLRSIPILKHVLNPSNNYQIDRDVLVDGYYYRFAVRTDRAQYEAVSVRELVKLAHEIEVLEHFRRNDKGGHVMQGVNRSLKGIGLGFKNIFVHPGQSVKRVGQGAGRFLRATGKFFSSPFRRKKSTVASDGTDRARFGKGPAGGERRRLAHELGIDVYTRNPEAQALLNEVARRRLAGSLPLSASVFALPGGAIFTLSLTPMGFDPTIEERIRDNDPNELLRLIGLWYEKQYGMDSDDPEGLIRQLLDNPNYSPREQAYLWRYLADLEGIEGVDLALEFLARQNTVERASIVNAQLESLALLHTRARRLKRFVPVRNTLGALTKDNTLCLIISIDTVRFWTDVRKSLQLSIVAAKKVGARRIEIWSTGDVDQKSADYARSQGVHVYQNILSNPIFRKPRAGVDPSAPRKRAEPERKATPGVVNDSDRIRSEPVGGKGAAEKKEPALKPLEPMTSPRGAWNERIGDNW